MAKHPKLLRSIPSVLFTLISISLAIGRTHATCKPHAKIDLLFLVDSSTSVTESNWFKVLSYIIRFVSKVDISDNAVKVALVRYADRVSIPIRFDSYEDKTELYSKLYSISHRKGKTKLDKGLTTAKDVLMTSEYGARDDVKKVLFIITDGAEEGATEVNVLASLANAFAEDGVNVNGIAVGEYGDQELTSLVTSPAEQHILWFDTYSKLYQDLGETLHNVVCKIDKPKEKRKGCFRDTRSDRTMPTLLVYERHQIDWSNFKKFLQELLDKCLNAAFEYGSGIRFIGLQYYGECWGGNDTSDYVNKGPGACVNTTFKPCTVDNNLCVGGRNSNFVYEVVYENIFL